MNAEQMQDKAATGALRNVVEVIEQNYCPSAELILAVRAFNCELATLLRKHRLAVTADGRIYSTGGPTVTGPAPA